MERIVKIVDRPNAQALAALRDHTQGDRAHLVPVWSNQPCEAVEREAWPVVVSGPFIHCLPGNQGHDLARQDQLFRLRNNGHGLRLLLLNNALACLQEQWFLLSGRAQCHTETRSYRVFTRARARAAQSAALAAPARPKVPPPAQS